MLDWYSRKQNNVVRSTYAAELMALLDALGTGTLMNVALTEISEGVCARRTGCACDRRLAICC
eukprot:504596-Pyramimonas_sp.AAC.1